MIRSTVAAVAVAVAGWLALGAVSAEDKKEVKLTGTMVCGKCALKETAKCVNVLQVKEGDKVVNYYLEDKGNGEPCSGDHAVRHVEPA